MLFRSLLYNKVISLPGHPLLPACSVWRGCILVPVSYTHLDVYKRQPIPRDRNGEFNPIVVPKHESRGLSIEKLVISLYSKGMSVSDVYKRQPYSTELTYGKDVTGEYAKYIKGISSRDSEYSALLSAPYEKSLEIKEAHLV